MATIVTAIEERPLDVPALIAQASDPSCGAVACFIGIVRSSASVSGNSEKQVVALDYDAHPELAPETLARVATQAAGKWPLERIVAVHRTGSCKLGEPTVVIACAAPHRGDALDACHWMIDEVKMTVPIWKKEIYSDGSSWVGSETG